MHIWYEREVWSKEEWTNVSMWFGNSDSLRWWVNFVLYTCKWCNITIVKIVLCPSFLKSQSFTGREAHKATPEDQIDQFLIIDKNGDGEITFEEWKQEYPKFSELSFRSTDLNCDGKVNIEEYTFAYNHFKESNFAGLYSKLVSALDENLDCKITSEELHKVLEGIMGIADKNSNGKVSYKEFILMVHDCSNDAFNCLASF